jgi:hypothetical protein
MPASNDSPLLRIFLPAPCNLNYPCLLQDDSVKVNSKVQDLFSPDYPIPSRAELRAYHEIFLSPDSLQRFDALNSESKKRLFIQRLLHINIPDDNYTIVRMIYNKDTVGFINEPLSSAILIIRDKMTKYISDIRKKNTNEKNHKTGTSTVSSKNKSTCSDPFAWFDLQRHSTLEWNLKFVASSSKAYEAHQLIKNFDTNWPWYSMINTIYESVDFIVYSGSHLVKPSVKLHEVTKTRLRFPNNKSFLLLFHGNLVHNGARAIPETDLSSFNYQTSLRFFSYVNKFSHASTPSRPSTRSTQQKQQSQGIRDRVNTDRHTCGFCDKCSWRRRKCCDNNWSYVGADNEGCIDIDIQTCFERAVQYRKKLKGNIACDKYRITKKDKSDCSGSAPSSSTQSTSSLKRQKIRRTNVNSPMHIVGNLEKHGWVVYEGIDMNDVVKYSTLHQQLFKTMKYPYRSQWGQIHGHNGSSRQQIKLKTLDVMNHDKLIPLVYDAIDDIYHNVLTKIPDFNSSRLESHQLLRNVGEITEQSPHSDWSSADNS